jgi:DNA-binding FadR family transcriptional regulator
VIGAPLRSGSPKAAQLIVADLRRQIIRGELQRGDSLPSENELMRLYGVSRPTLRESLRVLEFEGLLTVRRGPKGGSTVNVPTGEAAARSMGLVLEHRGASISDVIVARCIIGPACARLIAERGAMADLARLKQNLASNPGEGLGAEHSVGFHELLVELANNHTLTLLHGMLKVVLNGLTSGMPPLECTDPGDSDGPRAHDAHQHLVDLIAAKDGDQAEEFWSEHLRQCSVTDTSPDEAPLDFSA